MIKKINFSAVLIITCCVLFSTAKASLLNLELGLPDIFSNTTGLYGYNADNGLITIRATPLTISNDGSTLVPIGDVKSFVVSFYVDSSGQFIRGIGGDDLVIMGDSNVLLTGEVTNFGWHNLTNTNYAIFDFTFDPTGGELLQNFGDQTGGCVAFIEKSDFSGNWDENHEGLRVKIDTAPVIELSNQPPVGICQDVTISTEAGLCSADASVDDGSVDPDGDPITLVQEPAGPYELGDTEVTLTVTDDKGAFDTCNATVAVFDDEDPVISSVTTNPNKLWPPNLKMVPVTVSVDATDNCDSLCQIISVASNEPVTGLGYGYTTPDWIITSDLTVKLRAERSWIGSGRVYTITVECDDSSGNSSKDTVAVTVPYHYW